MTVMMMAMTPSLNASSRSFSTASSPPRMRGGNDGRGTEAVKGRQTGRRGVPGRLIGSARREPLRHQEAGGAGRVATELRGGLVAFFQIAAERLKAQPEQYTAG